MDCSHFLSSDHHSRPRQREMQRREPHQRSPTPEPPRRVDVWGWEAGLADNYHDDDNNNNYTLTSNRRSCFPHLVPRDAKIPPDQDRSVDVANFLRENNPPRRNKASNDRGRSRRKLVKRVLNPAARSSLRLRTAPYASRSLTHFAPKGVIPRISKDGRHALCHSSARPHAHLPQARDICRLCRARRPRSGPC